MRTVLAALLLSATAVVNIEAAPQRTTTDFEIATAERSLGSARTSADRVAAHLNLGDLRTQRMEIERARHHFREAEALARGAAAAARHRSDLELYSLMTAYRGIAWAKLGSAAETFDAFEEALRYQSDSARVWNYYASAMRVLGNPEKAAALARNAVFLAEEASATSQSAEDLLDLAIYRYALAGALLENDPGSGEAAELFASVIDLLGSSKFEGLRRQIGRAEGFEVFSFVRSDADAWLSLYNRSLLRLGEVRETEGDLAAARQAFLRVLERRSDDPLALAALARLSARQADRERFFAEAFAANPFSPSAILEYERHARDGSAEPPPGEGVQRAVWLIENGRAAEAAPLVAALASRNPGNAAIAYLQGRIAIAGGDLDTALAAGRRLPAPLRERIDAERMRASEERAASARALSLLTQRSPVKADDDVLRSLLPLLSGSADAGARELLDRTLFSSVATMDDPANRAADVTVFRSGSIGPIPFRFSVPTAFRGSFGGGELRITYRITGADRGTLLIEPLGIEQP